MKIVLIFGKKSFQSRFGRVGCSHGARWGGYNNYYYGIKYLFALCVYEGWGESFEPHNQWPQLKIDFHQQKIEDGTFALKVVVVDYKYGGGEDNPTIYIVKDVSRVGTILKYHDANFMFKNEKIIDLKVN